MININKIELAGTIGTATVHPVGSLLAVRFSLAVTAQFSDSIGVAIHTDWFNCSYFTKDSGEAERLCKGAHAHIEGRITTNEYVGDSGETRRYYEVKVGRVINIVRP